MSNECCHYIKTSGTLYFVGWVNSNGWAGDGSTSNVDPPADVSESKTWASIACGYQVNIGIDTDGKLWSCGTEDTGTGSLGQGSSPGTLSTWTQIGTDTDWDKVFGGPNTKHFFAIKTDGSLYGWGTNQSNELGLGADVSNKTAPVQIGSATDWVLASPAGSTGSNCLSLAINDSGELYWWGAGADNRSGSLTTPTQYGSATDWEFISGDVEGALAIKNGAMYCYGYNYGARFSTGPAAEDAYVTDWTQIGSATNWIHCSTCNVFDAYSLFVNSDGELWGVGYNGSGDTDLGGWLGDGTATDRTSLVQESAGRTDWAQCYAAGYASYGITSGGNIYAAGYNGNGAIGQNSATAAYLDFTSMDSGVSRSYPEPSSGAAPPTLFAVFGTALSMPFGEYIAATLSMPVEEYAYRSGTLDMPIVEGIGEFVTQELSMPIAEYIAATLSMPLSEALYVPATLDMPITEGVGEFIAATLSMPIAEMISATLSMPITFSAETLVVQTLDMPITELTTTFVAATLSMPVLELAPIYQDLTGSVTVTIGGRNVDFISCDVSQDESSPYWQASIQLADISQIGLFARYEPFTVSFYGDDYDFVVDTAQLSRGRDDSGRMGESASITGLSPLALQDTNEVDTVTQTWDAPTMAQSIMTELLGSVTWNVIDWPLPAYRFAVDGVSPLAAAQQLVSPDAGPGGVIVSEPDGTIIVRPLYPVTIPDYEITTPDIDLTADDITQFRRSSNAQPYYNRFQIGDTAAESSYQDSLEFVADETDGLKGVVRGYLRPWRNPALFRLDTSRLNVLINGGTVTIAGAGAVKIREETEGAIDAETGLGGSEIKAGRISVQYPIHSIVSVQYHDRNLGGVTFDGTDITTSVAGNSLVTITYRVQFVEWPARSTVAQTAQFELLESA